MYIQLTRGLYTIVDNEDRDLDSLNWNAHCATNSQTGKRLRYYARRIDVETKRDIFLHRVILARMYGPIPEGLQCDHINGNGLDNRRSNLRMVTPSQQQANRGKTTSTKTSKYKGVWYNKGNPGSCKWSANIVVDGKVIRIGSYETQLEGAKAYDAAAKKYFGEYARLNL
jgi:hypothetical protein